MLLLQVFFSFLKITEVRNTLSQEWSSYFASVF